MRRRTLLLGGLAGPAWWPGASLAALRGPVRFPRDHGAHPETSIEWWYVTGEVAAGERRYGFQVTFFRARTPVRGDHPSRFAATQLIFAHAAVSDLAARRLRHDQRVARSAFGLAEAAEGDARVHLRDWTFERAGVAGPSRYASRIASDGAGFAFDLRFDATQPVLLQGAEGWSQKGPDPAHGSGYYSEPQLAVTGRLTLDGQALDVRGRAWLDHEWSEGYVPEGSVGWDWTGMNLDDGGALMAFRMRRADGSALWAGGGWREPGGATRILGPDELRWTPLRRWRSPASQADYPVDWQLELPQGRFRIRPYFDAQELDSRGSTGAIYWEGLSELLDATGQRIGQGYLEMTGYASRLRI